MNERNILWAKHKQNPNEDMLEVDFIKKRQCVAKLIKETRDRYHFKEFIKCSTKPKKMWELVNTLAYLL